MPTSTAIEELPPLNKYSGAEIFLIDDEQLVVDTLTWYLRSAGFEKVQGFNDSETAINKMRFVRPDVVITDIRMPRVSGNKLAKTVRSFPHLCSVPIIAITGDQSSEASRSILAAGADSVLIKPVARKVLVQRAVQAIDEIFQERQESEREERLLFEADLAKSSRRSEAHQRSLRRRNRFR